MSDSSSGIAGLDRKAMEETRLARLASKRAATPHELEEPPKKAPRVEAQQDPSVDKVPHPVPETSQIISTAVNADTQQAVTDAQPAITLEFPDGAMRKTWAYGHERRNDIKIEEVLRKNDLKTAVISSFNWDWDFLITKFEPRTKFVFVIQAKNDAERKAYEDDFRGMSKRVRLCFPPMSGYAYGSMHSKLMLLFYASHLRVVVPSANFVPHDWGHAGILENSVFLIDLPRLPEDRQGHANDTLTQFSTELLRFLHAMEIHDDVQLGMLNFDFSKTNNMQFVHTIGGSHTGPAAKYTGFPGLSRAVRGLKLQTSPETELDVDMAASSVGVIEKEFLESLYRSLRGSEPRPPAPSKRKTALTAASGGFVVKPENFRIIFPSRQTVEDSTGGPENGGTLFLKPENYRRPNFPSSHIRDYISRRRGMISHNKLIFARSSNHAFLYHGSANASHAAWGRLSYDKESKSSKLTATNWECGVLLPVYRDESVLPELDETDEPKVRKEMSLGKRPTTKATLPIDVFDSILAVPFVYPAKEYEEGQLPWNAL